jgi:tyrosinase
MDGYPEANLQEMLGYAYSPTVISAVMASQNYSTFHGNLGGGPHESVHAGISQSRNGDMGLLTAPNGNPLEISARRFGLTYNIDPIFFLHHTQLDRLWWLWQQASPLSRTNDYAGKKSDRSPAALTDLMPMLNMAPDRLVRDFMSTETVDLCYRY